MDGDGLKPNDADSSGQNSSPTKAADSTFFYIPALLGCLRNYMKATLKADMMAGLNVAFVALPLSMALAVAAGASPQAGLYTSIIGGITVALFGGSRFQISGPTAAFVVILAPIYAEHGLHGMMFAGMMAGAILICMGLARLGSLIKFIPHPVTAGYNTGIALIIATQQIKELFGLQIGYDSVKKITTQMVHDGRPGVFVETVTEHINRMPSSYVSKMVALSDGFRATPSAILGESATVGLLTLGTLIAYPRLLPRAVKHVPVPAVGILVGIGANLIFSSVLGWNSVKTIGAFTRALPTLDWAPITSFNWSSANIATFIMPATSIAILCAVASLLSAVVSDGMTGIKHDANNELIGQGIGNIVSPLFGGIALSGAVARSVVNVRSGAKTPFASIFHSVTLLAIILIAGPYAGTIPLPSLAAILLIVAYSMADLKHFRHLMRAPASDIAVLFTCLALTVFVDMSAAISVGMILAAMLFMRRMSEMSSFDSKLTSADAEMASHDLEIHDVPRRVMVYSVDGPFFFGATEKAFEAMGELGENTRIVILRLNRVPVMDVTGLYALEKVYENLMARGITLILSGARPQPREVMKNAGFLDAVGQANIKPDIEWALVRCYELLGPDAKEKRTGMTTILPKGKL
ncbi:MAG: SulP family inorganic anion transporter [Planctomycetota bacterium]